MNKRKEKMRAQQPPRSQHHTAHDHNRQHTKNKGKK